MLRSAPARRPASKRQLSRLTDERLVVLVRRGNEAAFEELFERHSPGVLSFCSRLLWSREEGEDALQHAFLAVYRAIRERNFEPRAFKPWLYTIARNHCFSLLRSRRETAFAPDDEAVAAVGETAERPEQQAEVRELLSDVRKLPEPQRVALLLSELGDLSHTEIAQVIACPRPKVKSLLFQARASLCLSREARETPCGRVREELAGSSESRLNEACFSAQGGAQRSARGGARRPARRPPLRQEADPQTAPAARTAATERGERAALETDRRRNRQRDRNELPPPARLTRERAAALAALQVAAQPNR